MTSLIHPNWRLLSITCNNHLWTTAFWVFFWMGHELQTAGWSWMITGNSGIVPVPVELLGARAILNCYKLIDPTIQTAQIAGLPTSSLKIPTLLHHWSFTAQRWYLLRLLSRRVSPYLQLLGSGSTPQANLENRPLRKFHEPRWPKNVQFKTTTCLQCS